jgi:hypothetical protein
MLWLIESSTKWARPVACKQKQDMLLCPKKKYKDVTSGSAKARDFFKIITTGILRRSF